MSKTRNLAATVAVAGVLSVFGGTVVSVAAAPVAQALCYDSEPGCRENRGGYYDGYYGEGYGHGHGDRDPIIETVSWDWAPRHADPWRTPWGYRAVEIGGWIAWVKDDHPGWHLEKLEGDFGADFKWIRY